MLKPLPNYCVIEEIKEEDKTASGIYRAEKAQDKPAKGKIIAYSGIYFSPNNDFLFTKKDMTFAREISTLKVGAIVAFNRWATKEVTDTDGKKYQLVAFGDLLAIYE
jgi:co-chaperonin GroES (HSP10)